MTNMANLCLGTAQLGMEYGINNLEGRPSKEKCFDILDMAIQKGINVIDTADIYGNAELFIGDYLRSRSLNKNLKIITKQCKKIDGKDICQIQKNIRYELQESLEKLGVNSVNGYLLHSYREVENGQIIEILHNFKNEKLVENIGVSIYDIQEGELALASGIIDYIQMPYSIFDQRGMQSGFIQKAKEQGVKIFCRSAFLQGLLMMDESNIPTYLDIAKPFVRKLNELLIQFNVTKVHAIVKFVLEEELIDYMVFGVNNIDQLNEILNEKDTDKLPLELINKLKQEFCDMDKKIILPIHWNDK